jgi:ligand-binding sensor domain-containing protein/two-component sensor histidine kinase
LPIKAYTTADGLAHNQINKIVRDSRGFLWFCTADGLSRFDGYTFNNYGTDHGLPHPQVNDFLETRSGEYWIATNGGLVRFNPKGVPANRVVYASEATTVPMFSVITPDGEDRMAKGITVLLEDRNATIWCGTFKGLYRLDRANGGFALRSVDIGMPAEYAEQHFVNDLLEDRYGSLWIAAMSGLYRRWADGRVTRYTYRDGLPDETIHALLADYRGQLWAGTRSHGCFRFTADESDRPPVIVRSYTLADGLPSDWIFQIFESSSRQLWLGTNKGLVEFFPDEESGQRSHLYTTRNGLSYHEITGLSEDPGGNLWLASIAGAMKLARDALVSYDEEDGVAGVNAVFEDRAGGICFRGNVLGVKQKSVFEGARLNLLHMDQSAYLQRYGRFDGQSFTWFAPPAIKDLGWVGEGVTLQTHNGEWWLGTGFGLYHFPALPRFTQLKTARPLAVYTEKNGLPGLPVFRLFEDSSGNVWISIFSGARKDLCLWERANAQVRSLTDSPGLPSFKDNLARSFGQDRAGNIWIGFSTGAARYRHGSFSFFSTKDGLPPGFVQCIYSDRAGRLWLASSRGGVVQVDNPSAERPTFISYTTAHGLSSNSTEVITEDLQGHLYIGTGRGLDRLDPATGHVKHFTSADGLASGAFLSAFCDRNGALWFGTQKGLSRFVPSATGSPAPPPILITGVNFGDEAQPVSALGEQDITLPDLSANQSRLRVDFIGLSFAPGEVLRYQYKLEGTNSGWSEPGGQRAVNFANLAPGKYKFLVRAVNSDGALSPTPAAITFSILPPLWQRWWFLALAASALGMMVYGLYRYRLARLLEMANMRTHIAADLHDDIGANLTKISFLSEAARQQLGHYADGDGEEGGPLSSIARISRDSVASMSDIVWAINPQRDHLLDLTRRMRQHAEESFTPRDIELRFNAPSADEDLKLGADVRRDLLLIFKEAVNNAARHSRCSRVEVDFRIENSALTLRVADDGAGFDSTAESNGQGLVSMRRRAEKLRGTLTVKSKPSQGTTVAVAIPLSKARRLFR